MAGDTGLHPRPDKAVFRVACGGPLRQNHGDTSWKRQVPEVLEHDGSRFIVGKDMGESSCTVTLEKVHVSALRSFAYRDSGPILVVVRPTGPCLFMGEHSRPSYTLPRACCSGWGWTRSCEGETVRPEVLAALKFCFWTDSLCTPQSHGRAEEGREGKCKTSSNGGP